jgi:hypothetical protein
MFITKKYLSRRAMLRGAGVGLALPFLDAMVPAQTPLHKTAAVPKPASVPLKWCMAPREAPWTASKSIIGRR